MNIPGRAGGWHSLLYTWQTARRVGLRPLWRAMRTKNACKTCALGMGGQQGGMVNEAGHFPEVCKKSLQAMASDMQAGIKPEFFDSFSVRQLQSLSSRELEKCGRLTAPLYLAPGASHYRVLDWDAALEKIAGKLRVTPPQESFFYFSGRSSNEAGFLLQLFCRLYGTNHVNNCSYYCHQASGVGLGGSLGTGTSTVNLEDLEHCDLFFLIGGNPASNHPRLMTYLTRLRRRGGEVIVINPLKERGLERFGVPSDWRSFIGRGRIATYYLQPHIGGDIALLCGIAKALIELGAVEKDFVAAATEGYADFQSQLESLSWAKIEAQSGVALADIREVARRYAKARKAIFSWTMGITHHLHGVANVQTIVNVALMRGMVGKKGAGLLPIRGHSNVQGIGSMGVTPQLKAAIYERLNKRGIAAPSWAGYDTMSCMEAAHRGDMKFALCLGGNLYGSNPDLQYAKAALNRLEMLVYLNTTLNLGHAHATGRETIILPVLARDEESQKTTQESMFNFVRLSDGGVKRVTGARSEVSVITDLAERVVGDRGGLDWKGLKEHREIRRLISDVIPEYRDLKTLDEGDKEFTLPGRLPQAPKFATPSGKAQFVSHPLPDIAFDRDNYFKLMTIRSEGQFNTVVYEEEDVYRGQDRRDVILMHPDDMQRKRLKRDQLVTINGPAGTMKKVRVRPFAIKPGAVAMYYPEANVLLGRECDHLSRTPAFKAALVEVNAER